MADDLSRLRAEYDRRQQQHGDSDIYSLFNPAYLFYAQQRQRDVLLLLRRKGLYPLEDRRILEVGCGRGGVLLEYLSAGATGRLLHGVELDEKRLGSTKTMLPHLSLVCADGQTLPYADGSFDVVLQYMAMSSILDDTVKANLAREMLRVLRPGGLILWYDFWLNPTNAQTRGIRPDEIRRLFAGCRCEFQRITLAPPLARRVVPISWLLAALLERLRLFNSHYLAAIVPNS
ncbi:MAG: class I SAM-dependent methyltransferase [Burkholderiales bacterium]|nr:class I SAM-dependent methyltransferase [Anaerolineae bacterium]